MPELPISGLEYSPYGFVGLEARIEPPRALARSANLEMAIGELRAYLAHASGDLAMGRSCLIAGARGAGKTTMIDRAFEEARDRSQGRRLIRVRLHGPSLLNPPKPAPTKDIPNPAEIPVQEHVLKTLIINLYQTAAEEVGAAFARRANGVREDGVEFGAQLRLTLDGAPSAGTLRFFWDRIGALTHGVLFERADPDQGVREILALASAADAYRRCAGQLTQARTDALSAGEKAESKTELSASGKEISKALVGLASGVAAGATAAALTQNTPAIALAGAVTTLLSMMTLSYSRTRSRESTLKEEMTFLPDTTVSGLVHRVLLLIRRLRQAGLVPVFIIDELDKVANPVEPLNKLTTSLKFLFADEGFFCFLTDRTYFAEVSRRNREEANTTLRTIYNTQMLVRYDTASLNTFLKDVIHPYNLGGTITADQAADAEVLRYVLICRSRMLLFELSKDLRSFVPVRQQNVERYVNPEFNAPRDKRAHQLHLAVQLAIEAVLADDFVANRIERDPIFAQTIYDAMYYPVNLWYADQRRVDCSLAGLVSGVSGMIGEPLSLDDADKTFLQRQVKQLMELLVKLPDLEQRVADAINRGRLGIEHRGKLLDSIPRITLVKYTPEVDNPDVYKWNYTRSGIPYEASAIQDIQGNRDLWQAVALIGALSKTIPELATKRPSIDEVLLGLPAALAVIQSVTQLPIPAF